MSKKMRMIPSIFKNKLEAKPLLWQWPSCTIHPKTLSFRATTNDAVFKTVNSVFLDLECPDQSSLLFTTSSESPSFSNEEFPDKNNDKDNESIETIIRGGRLSERLFFEPGETNSIMNKEAKSNDDDNNNNNNDNGPFKESVAMAMESDDPYLDFKKSMEEMVESHGVLKDNWEGLEELLGWYLKMNVKKNHGFIVGAFVDLLMGLTTTTTTTTNNNNNKSSSSSLCSSSISTMIVNNCSSDEYKSSSRYSSATSSFSSSSSPRASTGGVIDHEDRNLIVKS